MAGATVDREVVRASMYGCNVGIVSNHDNDITIFTHPFEQAAQST